MSNAVTHNHNGQYVRAEACALMRERDRVELAAFAREITTTKRLTMAVLTFQFVTLGGLLLRWVIA